MSDDKKCTGCEARAALLREMWDAATNKDPDKFHNASRAFSQSLFDDMASKVGIRKTVGAEAHSEMKKNMLSRIGIQELPKAPPDPPEGI